MKNCSENKMTAIAVTLSAASAAKGLFNSPRKRSFAALAALRMTSTCVLEISAFHALAGEPKAHVDSGGGSKGLNSVKALSPLAPLFLLVPLPDVFQLFANLLA